MLFVTIYDKVWGITFLYVFFQLKCQSSQYDIYVQSMTQMRTSVSNLIFSLPIL